MKPKLKIDTKYAYIFNGDSQQVQYFENFKDREDDHRVIKVTTESRKGDKFFRENDGKILDMDVIWFGRRIKGKPMFIRGTAGAFDHIIIIK